MLQFQCCSLLVAHSIILYFGYIFVKKVLLHNDSMELRDIDKSYRRGDILKVFTCLCSPMHRVIKRSGLHKTFD